MSAETFRIEPLGNQNRELFDSGSEPLDRYLKKQASQDVRRRVTACFLAISDLSNEIAGYYTLTAAGVPLTSLAPAWAKKLPRYPVVPAALLGRLAISRLHQGHGLGGALLVDAIRRSARADLGVYAMIVDAKDERAQQFYERFGFVLITTAAAHADHSVERAAASGGGAFAPVTVLPERRLALPIDDALRHLAESH